MTENRLTRRRGRFWSGLEGLLRGLGGMFPLTWLSVLLLCVIYYVLYWEVHPHANQILFSVVALVLGVFAMLLTFTVLTSLLVFIVTRCVNSGSTEAEVFDVGHRIDSSYRVYRPFFMPFVSVEVEILGALEREEQRRGFWIYEHFFARERGRLGQLRRRVSIEDIFGLTRIAFVLSQDVNYELRPAQAALGGFVLQLTASGDGYSHPEGESKGELVEMRRYQAGDPLRLVLWKIFARSRKLLVRAPEPAVVEQNEMFVYFVAGPEDEASASMARAFLTSLDESSSDVVFAADGAMRLARDRVEGLNDVIDSVGHRAHGGEGLEELAPMVSDAMRRRTFMMLPSEAGPWLDRVKDFVQQFQVRPVFVLTFDASYLPKNTRRRSAFHRILYKSEEKQGTLEAREALCETLSQMGEVRLVDLESGSVLPYAAQKSGRL